MVSGTASVFHEIARAEWAALAAGMQAPLTRAEITALRGTGDPLDLHEVQDVYLPLSRLLSLYAAGAQRLYSDTRDFLDGAVSVPGVTPFIIGVAGSVAVGKSTISRVLRELLSRWPGTPRVDLITTDGFLYPNAELQRRGLMERKGFPESYDRRALLEFVSAIKSGEPRVSAPLYSHLVYDIVPGAEVVVQRPDVLIVEGLNVLQPAPQGHALAVSDLFDFTVYVDAAPHDVEEWYIQRFLRLRASSFANPDSYFHRYASLSDEEAVATARDIWVRINGRNLAENVLPTRDRATLVLRKGANHVVDRVLVRKI
ncbi:MAG TPA: type I pantothenate kinase [Microbacteriaceae bacterium]|nr:type I pantothenate kinase [Microbacteriaceae bacterium]